MELKFEQYTINGTPEEMATFLKLYELPGTVTKSIDSGNYSSAEVHGSVEKEEYLRTEEYSSRAEGISVPPSRHF